MDAEAENLKCVVQYCILFLGCEETQFCSIVETKIVMCELETILIPIVKQNCAGSGLVSESSENGTIFYL